MRRTQPLQDIGGVKFLGRAVSGIDLKDLKSLADEAKQSVGSGVVAIASVDDEGKAGIVVGVTADLTDRFDSVLRASRGGQARRQGRRRPPRYGAGRRARRRGGRRGSDGGRRRAAGSRKRGLTLGHAASLIPHPGTGSGEVRTHGA